MTLKSFSPSDIYEFLTRWPFKTKKTLHITRIYNELTDRPTLREMCTNPLILAMYVAEGFYCLGKIYQDLVSDDEQITVRFRVLGAQGRVLTTFDPSREPLWREYLCKIPEIVHELELPLAEWRVGTVALAVEVCKDVFARFNWLDPNLAATREVIEKMFSRRY